MIALLMGLWSLEGPAPTDPGRTVLGTAFCLLVAGALSRMAVQRGLRALNEQELPLAEASLRWVMTWPLLGWLVALHLFEWGGWVSASVPRTWWMVSVVLLFVPALIAFGIGWVGRAELQARIISQRGGVPLPLAPWATVTREIKRNLLIFIPMLVILAITEGIWVLGELWFPSFQTASLWLKHLPLLNIGVIFALLLVALPFIPRLFCRILKATPLEPGPLRETLERCAQAIDLRYYDIMVLPTRGGALNAMVVGFTPRSRTIFLTDGLLLAMPQEQIVAVFFHEAGHAKRNHLVLFLLSFLALTLIFDAASMPLLELGLSLELQLVLHLIVIWFGLLGWVSRRFERESDIYGADHAAVLEPDAPPLLVPGLAAPLPRGAALMMGALERIRSLAGPGGSHRHGTVEERVTYIADYATDPATRLSFRAGRRMLLGGLTLLLVLAAGLTTLRMPGEIAQVEALVDVEHALESDSVAWRLEVQAKPPQPAQAQAAYQRAHAGFEQARLHLGGLDTARARALRIQSAFKAADVAQHGLQDRALARAGFEETLALIAALPEAERKEPYAALLAFFSHVELGRLSAWAYAALPEGSEERDLGETLEHMRAAESLKLVALDEAALPSDRRRALMGERLRLLEATYEAARGEVETARQALTRLAQLGGDSRNEADRDLIEIRTEARREIERLGD